MIRTLLTTTALAALLSTATVAQEATTTPADPNAQTQPADPAASADATTPPAEGAAATNEAAPADTTTATPPADAGATSTTEPADTGMAAGGAMATPMDMAQGYQSADTDNLASRILGQPVYSSAGEEGENVGEINDMVLDMNGSIRAVIIGVGGFLGIGEKNVAVDFSQLQWTTAADNTERWVLETSREQLEAAPNFEFIEDEPEDTAENAETSTTMAPAADTDAAAPAANDTAMAPANDTAMAPAAEPAAAPAFDRNAMTDVDEAALTAENIIGTNVIGPDDEEIAEVGDILLSSEGQIDALLVDFGGFLGIGEKRVAVGIDNLDFVADEGGEQYVFLNVTREQLDAAPAYDEATYSTDPSQRLVVTP